MQMPSRVQTERSLTPAADLDLSAKNNVDRVALESYLKHRNAIISESSAAAMGSQYQRRIQAIVEGDARSHFPGYPESSLISNCLQTLTSQSLCYETAYRNASADTRVLNQCESELKDLDQAVASFCSQQLDKSKLAKLEDFFDSADRLEMKLEAMGRTRCGPAERIQGLQAQVNKIIRKVEQAAESVGH